MEAQSRREEPSRFAAFDDLVETCRRTRAALVAVVHERDGDGEMVRDIIAGESLPHVDAVWDGLIALARAGQFTPAELRDLVRRAAIMEPVPRSGPEAIAAAAEARTVHPEIRPADGRLTLAAAHARIVFSVLPTLPPGAVAWPRAHRTYADIPRPRSEAELLVRVEELAQVLWRVAEGRARRDESLRRALAFYEAGSRLSMSGGFGAA
ncbi:MAG TPA: hypothetical protein VFY23_11670 [Candidatus Limnocylindrales bacterium]|nr:hypothetical protein [Candidatus Limnocylindrales bacterium]